MNFSYTRLVITVLLIFTLMLIPLPVGYEMIRPLWGLLILLYIQLRLPDVFNYAWVVLLGLTLDVLTIAPLGEHLFALAIVAGMSSSRARRFKFFTTPQQMIWIGSLATLYQVTLAVINCLLGHRIQVLSTFLPIVMSILIWPMFVSCVEDHLLRIKSR